MSYSVGVVRALTARHYLVGGDFGPEGKPHGHDYRVEVVVEGEELDGNGFLVNIVRLEEVLEGLVERFGGAMLNDLPEFEGSNTSVEVFARVLATALGRGLEGETWSAVAVKLWESETAWASCRIVR